MNELPDWFLPANAVLPVYNPGPLDWPNPEWRFETYAWDAREHARQFLAASTPAPATEVGR